MIEPLETRIVPAAVFTYIDADGDDVTLKITKGIQADLEAAGVLVFSSADAAAPRQLLTINLSADVDFEGTGLTITAKRNAVRGGDGFVDIGYVNATGRDLGAVSIAGDLGAIDAGNPGGAASALKSLTVQSIGELGLSTGALDLLSNIDGRVDKLTVKGHVRDATIIVTAGGVGAATIGGSLLGGVLNVDGISKLSIAGDIRGGATADTGKVVSSGVIGSLTLGGSLVGTAAANTAQIVAGELGAVKIGGDIRGGTGDHSGLMRGNGGIGAVTLGGSLIGGGSNAAGELDAGRISSGGDMGAVKIVGDIRGGIGVLSGTLFVAGNLASLTLGGSIAGGVGINNTVAGQEGQVHVEGDLGPTKIAGSIRGGAGGASGSLFIGGTATSLTLGGSLEGGSGVEAGYIETGTLGTLKVGGSLIGGSSTDTGMVFSEEGITSATITGSVVGGSGLRSGRVDTNGALGKLTIGGDLRAGMGTDTGAVYVENHAGSITIKGSIIASDGWEAGIYCDEDIASITIGGSVIGTASFPAVITAQVNAAPGGSEVVLGKITIGGKVENALILAGYLSDGTPTNGDAQVGSVTVGGDWIGSSIVAGVTRGLDGFFGSADDQAMTAGNAANVASRIGSVVIKGQALGSIDPGDSHGFVAEEIGSIKVGTVSETLVADEVDAVPLGATLDFIAREDVVGAEVPLPNLAGTPNSTIVTVVSPTLATWIDVDGDLVTLKTTKPILSLNGLDFTSVPTGAGIQVQKIEWMDNASAAVQGLGVTITATPQLLNADVVKDGDGSVNIGYLSAVGIDLGAVKIAGDLARLECGDTSPTDAAISSLTLQSIGAFGKSTQIAASNLSWQFRGSVASLTVRGDLSFAEISISGTSGGDMLDNGTLGKLKIGGSLRGGATVADGGAGFIGASGKISSVTIGGDVIGGTSDRGGRVSSLGTIGAVTIGGSLVGGAGEISGQIAAVGGIASVKIGRDLRGGSDDQAGALDGGVKLGAVTIGGSMIGGTGEESGSVLASVVGGVIASVKVGGDVRGGIGEESAYIHAGQKLGPVTIAGSLVGGGGPNATDGELSALIYAGTAFNITQNTMSSVTIGGDIIGGSGPGSANLGSVFSGPGAALNLNIGKIAIKGSIVGGEGQSASITANNISSLSVGGSVMGGVGGSSANVIGSGAISTAKIGGSIVGGAGGSSGYFSAQTLGSLTIGRDLRGGAGDVSGEIFINFNPAKPIGAKSITLGGSLEIGTAASAGETSGRILVNSPLGALTIKGSVWGTALDPARIFARGTDEQTTPPAIGKLSVGGSAEFLTVYGGFVFTTDQPQNSDASLGSITVGGTWRAGSITAGVEDVDGFFGNANDALGTFGNDEEKESKIASIIIKGRALGTIGGGDHFGFVAQEIGAVKVGAVKFLLKPGAENDNDLLPAAESARLRVSSTGDFRIHEVPSAN